MVTYLEYIKSPYWARKRVARLKLDDNRCRLCDEDGTRFRLEVHHRPSSYELIPNESVDDDLITLCSRCHELITDVIREDRYGKREFEPPILDVTVVTRKEIKHGMANDELQVDRCSPVYNAQRANGRSDKQVVEIDETDYLQAGKGRC